MSVSASLYLSVSFGHVEQNRIDASVIMQLACKWVASSVVGFMHAQPHIHIIVHKANQLCALCVMRFALCSDKVTQRTQTTRHVGFSTTLFTLRPGSIPALWIALWILSGSSTGCYKNQNTNFDCITWHRQRTTVGDAPKMYRGVKSFVTFPQERRV